MKTLSGFHKLRNVAQLRGVAGSRVQSLTCLPGVRVVFIFATMV